MEIIQNISTRINAVRRGAGRVDGYFLTRQVKFMRKKRKSGKAKKCVVFLSNSRVGVN